MENLTKKQAVEYAKKLTGNNSEIAFDADVEIRPTEIKLKFRKKCIHLAYAIHDIEECGHFEFIPE